MHTSSFEDSGGVAGVESYDRDCNGDGAGEQSGKRTEAACCARNRADHSLMCARASSSVVGTKQTKGGAFTEL